MLEDQLDWNSYWLGKRLNNLTGLPRIDKMLNIKKKVYGSIFNTLTF